MKLLETAYLHGPNLWCPRPVLRAAWRWQPAALDLSATAARACAALPGVTPRWEAARRSPGGLLAALALELQVLAGSPVSFAHAEPGGYETADETVVVEFEEKPLAAAALDLAVDLMQAANLGDDFPTDERVAALLTLSYDVRLGPSTRAIVTAAVARGIPYRRLGAGSLVFFGQGASQRRACTAETGATSAIAETIAQDKELTRELLHALGAPVPLGRAVADAADAWAAAGEVGVPVVVKPQFGNHGRGVSTNLTTEPQVERAYAAAREEGQSVLVEQFMEGDDYRMLVIGSKLVAAARREPAHVVGDGTCSVEQLVAEVNRDPRRSDGHGTVLSVIKLDAIARQTLAEQGLTPESVPEAGRKVLIRRNANLSTGGTATDVTDDVHSDVRRAAEEAAVAVGLDIAGIDIVCRDVGTPLEAQRGGIVEVNAGPGLRMHLEPSAGKPRPVGEAIVELLYGPGEDGRIPVTVVTGGDADARAAVASAVEARLREAGHAVGRSSDLRRLMANPLLTAAVADVSPESIALLGLGVDRCDAVAIVPCADAAEARLACVALGVLKAGGRAVVLGEPLAGGEVPGLACLPEGTPAADVAAALVGDAT